MTLKMYSKLAPNRFCIPLNIQNNEFCFFHNLSGIKEEEETEEEDEDEDEDDDEDEDEDDDEEDEEEAMAGDLRRVAEDVRNICREMYKCQYYWSKAIGQLCDGAIKRGVSDLRTENLN